MLLICPMKSNIMRHWSSDHTMHLVNVDLISPQVHITIWHDHLFIPFSFKIKKCSLNTRKQWHFLFRSMPISLTVCKGIFSSPTHYMITHLMSMSPFDVILLKNFSILLVSHVTDGSLRGDIRWKFKQTDALALF